MKGQNSGVNQRGRKRVPRRLIDAVAKLNRTADVQRESKKERKGEKRMHS